MPVNSIPEAVQLLVEIERYLTTLQSSSLSEQSAAGPASDFNTLVGLLATDQWPAAVPPGLICQDTESDKLDRATSILEITVGQGLTNRKLLDFGCGEGHVSIKASEIASKVVGYDLVSSGNQSWESDSDKLLLTTDFSKVQANAPFDFVLLHDVLDHSDSPVDLLKQVATVCGPLTRVYVRCHPLTSRHGGHLYNKLNKAWAGLIFTPNELATIGVGSIAEPYKVDAPQKVLFPVNTYKQWFAAAGFSVVSEDATVGDVERFFSDTPAVRDRLISIFQPFTRNTEFPSWQLSQQFNDFVIRLG